MVNRELTASVAAVLAAMAIPLEQIATGEGELPVGHPHELTQTNHRGQEIILPKHVGWVMFETFRLPLQQHHHGAPPGGDIQRLVGGIQNENVAHARTRSKRHARRDLGLFW